MSVVYYVPTEDGELLVSTMAGRSKARMVSRDGKVSLCVLDERWPFAYLQVYADATVVDDRELAVDVMLAVAARMTGQTPGPEARPFAAALAEKENRVVLRCRPSSTFAQPPRHLEADDERGEKLSHWVSASLPWAAPDPM